MHAALLPVYSGERKSGVPETEISATGRPLGAGGNAEQARPARWLLMCAVASAPGVANVRVWAVTSWGRAPTDGGPPEGVHLDYPLELEAIRYRRTLENMPTKRKTPLTSYQKKAIKDARQVIARASREVRRILSNSGSEDLIAGKCRNFPVGHCVGYLRPTSPGDDRCRRRACRHGLLDHLAELPE